MLKSVRVHVWSTMDNGKLQKLAAVASPEGMGNNEAATQLDVTYSDRLVNEMRYLVAPLWGGDDETTTKKTMPIMVWVKMFSSSMSHMKLS